VSDRLDLALKAVANAEASRDFASQVRARLESGEQVRTAWWPRVATACATVLIAATLWWLRDTPPLPTAHVAQPTAPVQTAQFVAPQREPRAQAQDVPGNTQVVHVAHPVARVRTARSMTSDHDRALEPLSALDAISMSSVAPDAMVVVDHVIAPLAPIAPLSDVHDAIGDVNRGEL